ncbi:DUF1579 family protein [Candidatus Uabimicrobium sp. HlEnr_7]|uniref:DUF1579 family protein n=1 Tax=Candidatus Uabimicrobium helgolandensis TaxID=3095367 RepID=UPI00355906FD
MRNIFFLIFLSFSLVMAQSNKTTEQRDQEQKQKEQKTQQEWQHYASPNSNHQSLSFMAGDWKTISNIYDDKGQVFRQDAGTCNNSWILGGRFLLINHRFTQYQAIGVMGYDNYSNKFVAGYFDNQGTGTYLSKGTIQADKSIVLMGESISYFTGKPIKAKYVYTITGDNSYTFTLFNVSSSEKALKIIDITYTKSSLVDNNKYWTEKSKDVSKKDEQNWNKYSTPNKHHQALYPLIGNWKVSFLVYDEAGNIIRAPEGKAFNRSILGGRFALLHYKLDDYQSIGIMGFDNIKQKYTTLYIDNFGTGIYFSEGQVTGPSQFLLSGDSIDYSTGKPAIVTYDTGIISPNKYIFQLYNQKEKEELKIKKVHIECTKIATVHIKTPKVETKVPVQVQPKVEVVDDIQKPKTPNTTSEVKNETVDIKTMAKKIMADAEAKAAKIMTDAKEKADKVIADAKKKIEEMEK